MIHSSSPRPGGRADQQQQADGEQDEPHDGGRDRDDRLQQVQLRGLLVGLVDGGLDRGVVPPRVDVGHGQQADVVLVLEPLLDLLRRLHDAPGPGLDLDMTKRYAELGVQRLIPFRRAKTESELLDFVSQTAHSLIGRV